MVLDVLPGRIEEPLTGRSWEPATVLLQVRARAARWTAAGLRPGDRVFLAYGNRLEFFGDLLAVWSAGACAVPVDSRLTAFELETLARAARPRLALFAESPDGETANRLVALGVGVHVTPAEPGVAPADRSPGTTLDDDALILFTSGTTGDPKGVVHTHRSLRARWMSLRHALGLQAYRRTLCLLPTHFGHGLICNCLFPWLSGCTLLVLPPFRPDIVAGLGKILDRHEVTFLSSVPTVWRLALKTAAPPTKGTVERVFCGSAPLSAHLWNEIQRWTGARDVWNAYGITETGSWLAGTTVTDRTPEDGLIGEAWGGILRVLRTRDAETPPTPETVCAPGEPGHVWVHTPALMRGYLDRDDLTRRVVVDGWFATGDIGVIDERDRLLLRGREREEINKGGMKVYPGDVDAVVERFEGTVDVCTFAFEDPLQGEDVGIAVVLRDAGDDTLRRLGAWTRGHLAVHQFPKRWYVLDEIPRTSRGKVNRAQVAGRCAGLAPVDRRRLEPETGR